MKHSNIYEECHSTRDSYYTENYIVTGKGLETFCEIIHTYQSPVIIMRYEA